jgi:hypothetical protein
MKKQNSAIQIKNNEKVIENIQKIWEQQIRKLKIKKKKLKF